MAPAIKTDERSGVRVFPDLDTLSRAAADLFVELAAEAITARGRFTVGLSGGETPKKLYALLPDGPHGRGIEWNLVHLFWADERCVPPDHAESNYGLAHTLLLPRIAMPGENIHRIRGELPAVEAADEYEKGLRCFFGEPDTPLFDLIILGIGGDGHTASLFPGSPALRERHRLALAVFPAGSEWDRVTLTLPAVNRCRQALFLAAGQRKAAAVGQVLGRNKSPDSPAGLVRPASGRCLWFLDKDAAGELKEGNTGV